MEAGEPPSPQHSPALLCVCSHKIIHIATEHSACPEVAEASWARGSSGIWGGRGQSCGSDWSLGLSKYLHYRLLHC